MLPIYKDPDTDKWYYYDDGSDVGPFDTFEQASAAWAKSMQNCRNGSCES